MSIGGMDCEVASWQVTPPELEVLDEPVWPSKESGREYCGVAWVDYKPRAQAVIESAWTQRLGRVTIPNEPQ